MTNRHSPVRSFLGLMAPSERNSAGEFWVANFIGSEPRGPLQIELGLLKPTPYAIVECKRVGKEEGQKKGPTTIEKAKQGAYVANHVSRLQKVRAMDGRLYGALPRSNGSFEFRPFEEELSRLVYAAPPEELDGFVLTVGVVSNHGNWFTSDNPNKELRVLKQSYDWLLFLNDPAIVTFVRDTILSENSVFKSVAEAFQRSYTNRKKGDKNCFTKVLIDHEADAALEGYFSRNISTIETEWFSVLSPTDRELPELNRELHFLGQKLSRTQQ